MALIPVNPATGQPGAPVPEMAAADAARAVTGAHEAFEGWRGTSFAGRAEHMRAVAQVLRRRADDLARLAAVEMGKPLAAGRAEVEKCAWVCEYYAERAQDFLREDPVASDGSESFVTFQPLGVVLAVMPWNFPFWQVFRFAAPALMAGNAGVLKHASNVPGCAAAIEDAFREAGFPPGLFRNLPVGSRLVGDLIRHPLVRAVTLTGSEPAGRAVARAAGDALKKTVLELGGSDPYVVLADADLEAAASACAASRLINTGQSCIAAKRFVVVAAVREGFERLLVEKMRAAAYGDPLDPRTAIGPMARADLRDELHRQVRKSLDAGAGLVLGGEIPEGPGAYYPPTVLTGVKPGMPAYDEELFGPVAAVIEAGDEADAVRIANDSRFGLGAAVFTRDAARGRALAATGLEAGCVFVNAFVKSDPRLPFGGIKASGYGRELSAFGIREFVNIKSVYVK